MLTVVATIKAQPGKEETLIEIMSKLREEVRKEPGNLRYELLRSVSDPTTFVVYEDYVDAAALEFHMSTPHLKAAFAEMGSLRAGPSEIRRFQELK